jgi:Leucine-rich repeat (LRR) protein
MVSAEDGTLVAIVDRKEPYEICIIHDFRSGESWPYDDTGYVGARPPKIHNKWLALRRRIEASHPQLSRMQKLHDRGYLESTSDLDLNDADISDDDLQLLSGNVTIRRLRLERNHLSDSGLTHLRGLSELGVLDLTGNEITGSGFATLEFRDLDSLKLDKTKVDDEGLKAIGHLTTLRSLSLEGTQITDAGLAELRRLQNLQFLYVSGSSVTADGIARLSQELPKTHINP